jgi:hypothetical protein
MPCILRKSKKMFPLSQRYELWTDVMYYIEINLES